MGALPYAGFLWLTYSRQTPGIGNGCTDSGQIDGRPYAQIAGCVLFGRLSRFPYDAAMGMITGPEDVVMDGEDNGKQGCSQFSTHGITGLVVGADGNIYFSFGEGAALNNVLLMLALICAPVYLWLSRDSLRRSSGAAN